MGRLANLEEYWKRCRKNHVILLTGSPPAAGPDEQDYVKVREPEVYDVDSFAVVKERYEEAIGYLLSNLPDDSPAGKNQGNEDKLDINRRPKLPTISILVFSGTYCEWLSFGDLFSSLIIENESLSDAEHLHYLKASLQREVLVVAQNQPGTSDNF